MTVNNHVDHPFINPRILSYCPGILGLDRGIKRAIGTTRTVAYVEIEAFICENLLAGMEAGMVDAAPIWCNLKTFNAAPFRGSVDGITGGYPCQPFSNAGERRGTEDPRHLYPYLERDIRAIQPVWCFFENVAGHLTLGFPEVRESLSDLGYNVEAGIFTAEEVGAPHERERLFILAIRRDWLANAVGSSWRKSDITGHQFEAREKRIRSNRSQSSGGFGTSGQEMANANNDAARGFSRNLSSQSVEAENKKRQKNGERCGDVSWNFSKSVGNAMCEDQQWDRLCSPCTQGPFRGSSDGVVTVGLANGNDTRCEEQRQHITAGTQQPAAEYPCYDRWPARPGQPQHDWEEPRTIITAHAARLLGGYGKKYPESFPAWQIEQVAFDDLTGAVKPEMGVTADGYNFREDVLRAAGNSVVEQTAELAFLTLLKKHGL